MTCTQCQREFQPKNPAKYTPRFCGQSCAGKWRLSQPSIRAKLYNSPGRKRIGKGVSRWYQQTKAGQAWRVRQAQRMTNHNPMAKASTRAVVSATLRAMGHKPSVRGGNGHGPTKAERRLLRALRGTKWQHVVATKIPRGLGWPTNYKIDVAIPDLLLAVEVDGLSHSSIARQLQDGKKDRCLELIGWTVLRFSNQQIEDSLALVLKSITSQSPGIRLTSWGTSLSTTAKI